jgi:hypothetical protein
LNAKMKVTRYAQCGRVANKRRHTTAVPTLKISYALEPRIFAGRRSGNDYR